MSVIALQPSGNVDLLPTDGETIAGGAFPGGSVTVADGTVTLGAPTEGESVELDANLVRPDNITLWVDANLNCITNADGAVTQWCDVREKFDGDVPTTNHTFSYKRLIVHQPEAGSSDVGGTPPTFKTDARHPGLRFLDFGNYGSGRWMYLADPQGNFKSQRVHTFYCVVGFDTADNCGHILSEVESLSAKGSGTVYFHKGLGGSAGGNISTTTEDSCLYNGETRLNGARIDPRETHYIWDAFQVFGQVGPYYATKGTNKESIPTFSTIFNDRNITFGGGYRQGGGVLGELLTWNCVLTEAERRQVESYLYAKWFRRVTAGTAKIASGAYLVVETGSDASVNAATGDGKLVKRGAEKLTVERTAGGAAARIRVEEGSVTLTGGPLGGARIDPVIGQRLTVGAKGSLVTAAASRSDRAEIVGSGTGASASLAPEDLVEKEVYLESVKLSLAPHEAADYAEPMSLSSRFGNLLTGASFESPVAGNEWYKESADGWMFKNASSGVANYKSPWYGKKSDGTAITSTIPDGKQFLYIQHSPSVTAGEVSQKFTAPVSGLYRLSFYMSRRTSRSESEGEVVAKLSLDGTNFFTGPVAADYRGDINVFKQYSAYLPPLAQGEHTLTATLDDTVSTKDRALLLDKLELTPIAEGEYLYIPNAGFDSCAKVVGKNDVNGWFRDFGTGSTNLPGWSVAIGTYTQGCSVGLTRMSTWWSWKGASTESPLLSDYSKVYLQGNAEIQTTFVAPRAGKARFSIVYSNRANANWDSSTPGSARNTGHRMNVYVDGNLVTSASPVTALNRVCQGLVDLTPGEHTLKIENKGADSGVDVCTVVDEPRLVYVDSEPRVVPSSSFLDFGGVWTTNNPSVCQWERDPETGYQKPCIGNGGEISQTVTIPSNGYWQVAAELCGRTLYLENTRLIYNNWRNYPSYVDIRVDGALVGTLKMEDGRIRRYALPLPYLEAGRIRCRSRAVRIPLRRASSRCAMRISCRGPRPLRRMRE